MPHIETDPFFVDPEGVTRPLEAAACMGAWNHQTWISQEGKLRWTEHAQEYPGEGWTKKDDFIKVGDKVGQPYTIEGRIYQLIHIHESKPKGKPLRKHLSVEAKDITDHS